MTANVRFTMARLHRAFADYAFHATSEAELQDGIAQFLGEQNLPFQREVKLADGERIDFLVEDHLGVEVKVEGATSEIARQLERYAKQDVVHALLLVTTRMLHASMFQRLPEICSKPLRVYSSKLGVWRIKVQPHVALRMKRVFGKLGTQAREEYHLSDTPENARDIEWFMDRYPLEIDDAERLRRRSQEHTDQATLVEDLLNHVRKLASAYLEQIKATKPQPEVT
jgi:hypothetical protein